MNAYTMLSVQRDNGLFAVTLDKMPYRPENRKGSQERTRNIANGREISSLNPFSNDKD